MNLLLRRAVNEEKAVRESTGGRRQSEVSNSWDES